MADTHCQSRGIPSAIVALNRLRRNHHAGSNHVYSVLKKQGRPWPNRSAACSSCSPWGVVGQASRFMRELRPNRRILVEIFRISLPAFGESVTNLFCQLWFLALINRLGETATAAHGVAIRCEAIAFLTVIAFSVAASTLTGQYLGGGSAPGAGPTAAILAWKLGVAGCSAFRDWC